MDKEGDNVPCNNTDDSIEDSNKSGQERCMAGRESYTSSEDDPVRPVRPTSKVDCFHQHGSVRQAGKVVPQHCELLGCGDYKAGRLSGHLTYSVSVATRVRARDLVAEAYDFLLMMPSAYDA